MTEELDMIVARGEAKVEKAKAGFIRNSLLTLVSALSIPAAHVLKGTTDPIIAMDPTGTFGVKIDPVPGAICMLGTAVGLIALYKAVKYGIKWYKTNRQLEAHIAERSYARNDPLGYYHKNLNKK